MRAVVVRLALGVALIAAAAGCSPPQPNLQTEPVTASAYAAAPGQQLRLTVGVIAQSSTASPATQVRFTASTLALPTADAPVVVLGSAPVPPMAPHHRTMVTTTVTLPRTLPLGPYQIAVCVDPGHLIAESDETDNCNGTTQPVVVDDHRATGLAWFDQAVVDPATGDVFASGTSSAAPEQASLVAFTADGRPLGAVAGLTGTWGVALSPSRHLLFAAQPDAHRVAVIDTRTRALVGYVRGAALDEPYWPVLAGNYLYVGELGHVTGPGDGFGVASAAPAASATLTDDHSLDSATWLDGQPTHLYSAGEALSPVIADLGPEINGVAHGYSAVGGHLLPIPVNTSYPIREEAAYSFSKDGTTFATQSYKAGSAGIYQWPSFDTVKSIDLSLTYDEPDCNPGPGLALTPDSRTLVGGVNPATSDLVTGRISRIGQAGCQYFSGLVTDPTGHTIYTFDIEPSGPAMHIQRW